MSCQLTLYTLGAAKFAITVSSFGKDPQVCSFLRVCSDDHLGGVRAAAAHVAVERPRNHTRHSFVGKRTVCRPDSTYKWRTSAVLR